jgi:phytoene dehydrogenase-like protein
MPSGYDAVVIGAGHNGLTCGCYLAKAGLKVLVLEQYSEIGGMTISEEIAAPGFLLDVHASGYLVAKLTPAPQELGLAAHGGLELITPDPNWAQVFPDGKALAIGRDLEMTVKSFAQFSAKDGETWRALYQSYLVAKPAITAGMNAPPPSLAAEFAGAAEVDRYRFQFQSVRSWAEQTLSRRRSGISSPAARCMPASHLTTRSARSSHGCSPAPCRMSASAWSRVACTMSRDRSQMYCGAMAGRCAYALRWPRSNARTAAPRPCRWQAARGSR